MRHKEPSARDEGLDHRAIETQRDSDCKHERLDPVHETPWSDEGASGVSSSEIKRRWPRQTCRDCGTIYYQSFMHYIAGDW